MLPARELPRISAPTTPADAEALIEAVDAMPICIERDGLPLGVMLTAAQFDGLLQSAAAAGLAKE
jgi:hypothetical protein